MRRARRSGMAGATVVKGFEGFGGLGRVHRAGAQRSPSMCQSS
jgi:PII-like signaling protein